MRSGSFRAPQASRGLMAERPVQVGTKGLSSQADCVFCPITPAPDHFRSTLMVFPSPTNCARTRSVNTGRLLAFVIPHSGLRRLRFVRKKSSV